MAQQQRITDAHGNFIEKKRWTKKRAMQAAAKKRAAAGSDDFSAQTQPKVEAPAARPTFGQRSSAMLTLLNKKDTP
jgi:hypothetical protein